ncbi:hypothetical protein AAFC00_000613 [Neodothiora populina]|uniref:Uncharacterized protein n=1 Tax=Neodothiora populina TaxID=2781224 RepID=A0ABR3PDM3_9PEZI
MRFSCLSCLVLPALAAASPPVVGPPQKLEQFLAKRSELAERSSSSSLQPTPTVTTIPTTTLAPTPPPEVDSDEYGNILELRQAAGNDNLGATLDQPSQKPPVTTNWVESTNDITTTWVQVIYTQTFASAPGLMSTSGSGSIGLGTHTGTVGVVKVKSGTIKVMPSGTFVTVALGFVGMVAGMGMIIL